MWIRQNNTLRFWRRRAKRVAIPNTGFYRSSWQIKLLVSPLAVRGVAGRREVFVEPFYLIKALQLSATTRARQLQPANPVILPDATPQLVPV